MKAVMRWFAMFAGVVLGVGVPSEAPAVGRQCRWNVSEVPVYVNLSSFASRGYTTNEVIGAVSNAMQAWNVEGQSNFRFYYGGDSSLTSAASGTVLIVADTGPVFCWLAQATFSSPVCGQSTITVFDKTNDGCLSQPLTYQPDAPDTLTWSLTNILVHELGHSTGFTDDPGNPLTVMQGAGAPLNPASLHLYNADISLLQNGDPAFGITGYLRRNNPILGMESTDGVTWTNLPGGSLGGTAYRPAIAASATHKVLAFVDTTPSAINGIATRRFSAGVWSAATPVGSGAVTGVALAYGGGRYVLAFTSPADTRDVKVRTSLDGLAWSAEISVGGGAGTQSAPGIAYNAGQGRFNLFWTDINDDRLRYATSTDGAIWTAPSGLGTGRELFALDGAAAACIGGACLLVWPSWNTYGGLGMPLCTMKYIAAGAALSFESMNCQTVDSARSPGLAVNPATGRFVVVRAGRDANNSLSASYKTLQTTSGWSAPVGMPWQNAAGVDVTFNPATNKFETYFADR